MPSNTLLIYQRGLRIFPNLDQGPVNFEFHGHKPLDNGRLEMAAVEYVVQQIA